MKKALPHQPAAINKMRKLGGRVLLADDMGLGKTYCALTFARKMVNARPVLVVCPASLKYNWEREARVLAGMSSIVCEGQKPPKGRLNIPCNVVIINYEILKYWRDFIKKLDPQIVIMDECHGFGNRTAKRTIYMRTICRRTKYVIALSGTPLQNRPKELFPVLNMLRPDLWPNFNDFGRRYCNPTLMPWGKLEFNGAANLDELHKLLTKHVMIRRRKSDVGEVLGLKDKTRHVLSIGLSDPHEYTKAKKNFKSWIKRKYPRKARKALKAEALTKLGYLLRLASELKFEAMARWVDLVTEDQKLVLMCKHKEIVRKFHERFPNSVVIDGSVKGRKRQRAIDQFQKDPKTKLLIGNLRAAGVGHTLTAASILAFAELGWTPGEHEQAEDRIYRIGQEDDVAIYYLIARGTIEERIAKLLFDKKHTVSSILDGEQTENTFDFFEEIIRGL